MARQLFGTDGIRGVAGVPPLDPKTAYALGIALGEWVQERAATGRSANHEVVIGMDTRESGTWIAEHVAGGLKQSGVRSHFAGVITTPGVAYLARTNNFSAGVMISASHNPYQDNGIKVIDHSGYKLADHVELHLEQRIFECLAEGQEPAPLSLEIERKLDHLYTDFLAQTATGSLPFRLVIDCANGSATEVAPRLFERLGATVDWIGAKPDGRNINLNCGSLHLDGLQKRVLETGADLGIAFDGDADRALFVSGSGRLIDGDAVLFIVGSALKVQGKLPGSVVVATVMSNLGLQKAFESHGIEMVRTPVGDKYVLEEMLKRSAVLGGEQSGHVIFTDYATTGDGLLTALRVLEVVKQSGQTLDQLADEIKNLPQKLVNVRVQHKRPLAELAGVQREIQAAEEQFAGLGRVLVRFSGTEPLARVMIEANSHEEVERWTVRIADAIKQELGAAE